MSDDKLRALAAHINRSMDEHLKGQPVELGFVVDALEFVMAVHMANAGITPDVFALNISDRNAHYRRVYERMQEVKKQCP
jgi:hypothetical protein